MLIGDKGYTCQSFLLNPKPHHSRPTTIHTAGQGLALRWPSAFWNRGFSACTTWGFPHPGHVTSLHSAAQHSRLVEGQGPASGCWRCLGKCSHLPRQHCWLINQRPIYCLFFLLGLSAEFWFLTINGLILCGTFCCVSAFCLTLVVPV